MSRLHQIQKDVRLRAEAITSTHTDWPCRKGCDECCRRLASVPRVTQEEWELISVALDALPPETAEVVRMRVRDSADASRPIVCPLLDTGSGACLVYEARPIACRAYGFYTEREHVLGCSRIETISWHSPDVVWGNHVALEDRLRPLGIAMELPLWMANRDH